MAELVFNKCSTKRTNQNNANDQAGCNPSKGARLGEHYRIVKEYCLAGVVTPPCLSERASLSNKAQKAIRTTLCLVVLICIYQHERVWDRRSRSSAWGVFWRQMKQSISLNFHWGGPMFIIHSMFRSWRVGGDTVGRCVTGQRLPLNDTAHTLGTAMAGFRLKVYLRRDQNWMHEIDLFPPGHYCYISWTQVWPWWFMWSVWGQRED